MKLLLAIVNDDDASKVNASLREEGFSATKISSTGGFLQSGNTTFIIGVNDEDVKAACDVIEKNSKKRTISVPASVSGEGRMVAPAGNITVGGATVFVLGVEEFKRL